MSSPRPKEKLSQKLSRLLKPRKRVAGASATSSHSTPLSSSPSQTRSATDDAGHVMDTSRTIAPDASGTSAPTDSESPSFAGVTPTQIASPQASSNIAAVSQETTVSSPTGDATRVEPGRYPSQLARPSETMGPADVIDRTHDTDLGATLTSPSTQLLATEPETQDSTSKLTLAWQGVELLLKKVERCLDGTPAKAPVAAINGLIELKNAVGDNNDALQDTINQAAERLKAMDKALGDGVPDAALARMKTFADSLQKEINELKEMSSKGRLRKLLESEIYKVAIARCFKQIDEATKTFLLDISWSTERKVYEIDSDIKKMWMERLLRGRKAIYNTDLGGGLTRETCTEGTRTRIREDIIGWAMDSSPESQSVFWLTGQAGSGKTTIAYTIAQYFDRLDKGKNPNLHTVFGGSFFCSRQFEETRERIRILPTIVYQLARKSRSYARALHKADKFDSYDKLFEQMEDLLCGPWQESEGERRELPPYLIVIDALDEIEGQEGSAFLADLLKAIDGHYLQGLKFFVTSRPDPDVTELCNSLPPKVVRRLQDVPREDVGSDIDTYLRAKLPNLGKAELDKAAEQADGLFIFAATVVRYLTPRRSITRREQSMLLEKLLSHKSASGAMQPLLIDELYKHILHQAFSDLSDDIFRVRLHILHTFLCTIERTTTSVAAALLSEPDDEIVNAVLSDLHAVLYCKDGQVLWYHASFPDFIFTHERSRFKLDGLEIDISCNEAYQHAFLTKACFDVMLSGNTGLQFNIGEIPSSFIFDDEDQELAARVNTNISAVLKYACHHWATHLTQSGQVAINSDDFCKDISKFLDIYILFWIEAMNLLKASGQCSTMLQHAHKWVLGNTNDQLELAASITEAANFAIYFTGNPTAKATPHLYISSLATWSKDSILSQQWRKQFPCIPAFTYLEDSDRPLMTFNSNNLVKCIALSNNGTHIVLGSFTGVIEIWNASSGNNLKLMNGHTNWVNSVAFSSDDTYIVSGSQDNSVRIWDALSGAEIKVLNGHGPITSVAFSSDRSYIVSGSLDHSIQIWDASSGAELKILNGHTKPVNSVAFSNNSIYIVSGSSDNSVRVWDALSGAELKVLNGHTKAVNSVAFSYDGTHIVSGSSDNSVQVWDALSGAKLKVLNGHTKTVTSVMFSSDATQIISGSFDKSVRIWNALSGAELKVISHTHAVCSVVLSSDGTHIVSVGSFDDPVYVWDASSRAGPRALNGHTRSVNSVAFSGDGTYIVSGSIDNSMQIWDALSGAEIKVLNGHTKLVNSVAFSSDSSYIVSGSGDHSVRVWDISSGAELKMLNGHTEDVTSVAFSNDDVYIVSGSGDKSIWVWDASSGAPLKVLNGHTKGITSVAFSQDSIYIVSGSKDKSVRIWDASSGVELKLMNGHNGFVLSVAFSNDSTHIISGSRDSVRIWNSLSGAMLKVLTNDIWGISNIKSVAFSSNSTYIVSGSWDNSVHIWDALSGTKLKVLNGHSDAVNSVAFSSDGTYIVSGSKDRSVRVWDASSWVTPKVLSGHTNAITHTISSSSDHATQVSAAEPPFSQWTDWTHTDDNQIITLPSKHCLMWVPPGISLFSPHTLLIMSHFGSASINFEHCKIGPDWAGCYVPT